MSRSRSSKKTPAETPETSVQPAGDSTPPAPPLGNFIPACPIDSLQIWDGNPRKLHRPGKLEELADDLKRHGMLQPIVARDLGNDSSGIVCGERRWRAAKIAGLATVPVLHRGPMSDEEAVELAAVENGQREDIHPVDEAASYAVLRERGYNAADIAAKVSKSEKHVQLILLLVNLPEQIKQALLDERILLTVALEIARIATPELQLRALASILAHTEDDALGLVAARRLLRDMLLLPLSSAPFSLADADLLPEAGACTSCPKQTSAQRALFDDTGEKNSFCLDDKCYAKKNAAFVERERAAAEALGMPIIEGKAAQEMFPHGPQTYSPRGDYVRLDQQVETKGGSRSKRTYVQALQKVIKQQPNLMSLCLVPNEPRRGSRVKDDSTALVHVMKRKDFIAVCAEAKVEVPYGVGGTKTSQSDKEKQEKRQRKFISAALRQAHQGITTAAAGTAEQAFNFGSPAASKLMALLRAVIPMIWHRPGMQAPRAVGLNAAEPPERFPGRYAKTGSKVETGCEELTALNLPQLFGMLVGLVVEREGADASWHTKIEDVDVRLRELCEQCDIDLKQLVANEAAASKPAKAKKKDKAAGPKPKTSKKKGTK